MIQLHRLFIALIAILATVTITAQTELNQFDKDGKRDGHWAKNFDQTKQPRYEGQFEHGKEVGLFKFYTLSNKKSVLSATKTFNPSNANAEVVFYSSKGKKISEGQMDGKRYVGKWIFYHNKSEGIMFTETYNNKGLLEGEKTVFYPNGKIAETSNYKEGKLNGPSKVYSETGTLLKDYTYQNDELHGPAKYYDADGNLNAEGVYQHDRKHAIWNYYENGVLKETKDHTRRSQNPKQ